MNLINITSAGLLFLAAGIFTSVSILSIYQILFAVPVIWFTYLAIKNKNFDLPKSAWWLLAFVAIAFISLCINFELIPKPMKNFGRLKYYLYGIGGIFVFRTWLDQVSNKTKKILTSVFLLSIIIAGIVAFYSYLHSEVNRAKGLTDTMRYGYGSGMALLVLLSAILQKEKTKAFLDMRLAVVAFVVGFIGMYLTYTRGALLGFMSGLPFVLYYYRPKLGFAIGGLALVGAAFLGYFYLFGNVQMGSGSRFLMSKNNSGDEIRRSQWESAIIAIKEKPILGYGLSNFHSQLKRIKEEYNLDRKDYNDAHSHNLFLEVASGTGLFGLFLFLGWLISWAIESFKMGGLISALIIPFGVAFVVSSQFEVTFDANNASMIFFLYGLSSSRKQNV